MPSELHGRVADEGLGESGEFVIFERTAGDMVGWLLKRKIAVVLWRGRSVKVEAYGGCPVCGVSVLLPRTGFLATNRRVGISTEKTICRSLMGAMVLLN